MLLVTCLIKINIILLTYSSPVVLSKHWTTTSFSVEGSSGPKDQASIPPGPPHHVTTYN